MTMIGQHRRARRFMLIMAEQFIRAYIAPILDWLGRGKR